jgi:hypothetical protein
LSSALVVMGMLAMSSSVEAAERSSPRQYIIEKRAARQMNFRAKSRKGGGS